MGETVVRQHTIETAKQAATPPAAPVVVGLDGGYVRSRHCHEECHFEVIAGKVIDADGTQHRFAFARNGQAASAEAFAQALGAAGVHADTPATVLCDGDAGLWRLQRETLPEATLVLDWWHIAMRFEHALQAARGLADKPLSNAAARGLERVLSAFAPASITGSMKEEIFQAASNTLRTVAVRRRKWNLRESAETC